MSPSAARCLFVVAHGLPGAFCCPRAAVPGRCAPERTGLAGGGCHRAGCQPGACPWIIQLALIQRHALGAGHGTGAPPAGCDSPRSNARTSDSRNLRCPPGVRMLLIRPDAAHRVTVFGSTRKSAATSPGVRRRSLLPSTELPSHLRFGACLQCRENIRLLPSFPKNMLLVSLVSFGSARSDRYTGAAAETCWPDRRLYTKTGGCARPGVAGRAMCSARLQNVQGAINWHR